MNLHVFLLILSKKNSIEQGQSTFAKIPRSKSTFFNLEGKRPIFFFTFCFTLLKQIHFRFSGHAIARGLPLGCLPYENSPACEIDECLLTHMGDEHLTTHERQVWAVGIYDRATKKTITRVVGNTRTTEVIRPIVENVVMSDPINRTRVYTDGFLSYNFLHSPVF